MHQGKHVPCTRDPQHLRRLIGLSGVAPRGTMRDAGILRLLLGLWSVVAAGVEIDNFLVALWRSRWTSCRRHDHGLSG